MFDLDPGLVDDILAHLSEGEQAELEDLLERASGGERLHDFIARHFPTEPPPRHLQPLLRSIETARIVPIREAYSLPPGHAKTTTFMRAVPWWLERSPADQCAYVTYSDKQARDKSQIARDLAGEIGLEMREDADSLSSWRLPEGGGLLAAGARGKLMGQRIPGMMIWDDPYPGAIEARSPIVRGAVSTRFRSSGFTRLQGGSILVTHTRYAVDDLYGEVAKLGWRCINIPAIAEVGVPDPLGRAPGEAAWPEQYPVKRCDGPCGHAGHLDEIRETIGPFEWASLYQGRPMPAGGRPFIAEPSRFKLEEFRWIGKRGVITCDPAATSKTSGDYSAIQAWAMDGYGSKANGYVVDAWRGQISIPELCRKLIDFQKKYFGLVVAVESVAGFKSVPQILRETAPGLRILEIAPRGDKFTRAQPYSAAWNARPGRIHVPIGVSWAHDFIAEHQSFTGVGDTHDDQVDAGAHAWNTLYREVEQQRTREEPEWR